MKYAEALEYLASGPKTATEIADDCCTYTSDVSSSMSKLRAKGLVDRILIPGVCGPGRGGGGRGKKSAVYFLKGQSA